MMFRTHLVRIGQFGQVGQFVSIDQAVYPRRSRVVVRSARGLEVGEVLGTSFLPASDDPPDGDLLRGMTVEDELLAARLQRNRLAALEACQTRLDERGIAVPLMEVDLLFDGRTLIFYFLGAPTAELDAITSELAEVYDARAQIRQFADTLTSGCGPGCGDEHAEGQGCMSCATGCAIAGACGKK